MSTLQFSDELPEGAIIVGEESYKTRGISKREVAASLRSQPNRWALVYPETSYHIVTEWKKRKDEGFEVATVDLPEQDGRPRGSKRMKVWLRYVPVQDRSGPRGEDGVLQTGVVPTETPGVVTDAAPTDPLLTGPLLKAVDAEPVPAAPPVPPAAPTPPVPVAPTVPAVTPTGAVIPPPKTAFEAVWADGNPDFGTESENIGRETDADGA